MRKAQSSLEYATVIFCVVLALLAMRVYVTRGLQGRLRQVADDLGQQYDPRHTNSDITTMQGGHTIVQTNTIRNATTNKEETITTTNIHWESEWRYGNETVQDLP